MTVYISGPITGIPNWNKTAFQKAQREIKRLKKDPQLPALKIINPLRIGAMLRDYFNIHFSKAPKWEDYMKACVKKLCDADCLYFLKGWEVSEGACVERYIAKRLMIFCADTLDELKANLIYLKTLEADNDKN